MSPQAQAGKLMEDLACFSCHRINGHGSDHGARSLLRGQFGATPMARGASLKNPNTLRPALTRRMPRFNLSDTDRNVAHRLHHGRLSESPNIDPDSQP
jgi:mono/diheme cytochrome c family protein